MSGLVFSNIAASLAILMILLLRRLFREKFSAKVFVLLWVLVILRLLLPFEFSSPLSIFPSGRIEESSSGAVFGEYAVEIPSGETAAPESFFESRNEKSADFSPRGAVFALWISGAVLSGGFFLLRHRVGSARLLEKSVPFREVPEQFRDGKTEFFLCNAIASPLSFGILRPRILLPEGIAEKQLFFVLLHEKTHTRNRDAALKALALSALALNWFNPAVWVLVRFFERDIELRCDEEVLSLLGWEKASEYAKTILDFAERESLSLNFFSAAPLCERVTSIMKNKNRKKNFFAAAIILSLVIIVMTACGTLPESKKLSVGKGSPSEENLGEIIDEISEPENEIMDAETGEITPAKTPDEEPEETDFSAEETERALETVISFAPVDNHIITCAFSGNEAHAGVDIISPEGSGAEIHAVGNGTVLSALEDAFLGKYIVIDHGNGTRTLYAHCQDVFVSAGNSVKAGDIITAVGCTGNSTGAHLHFEILMNGTAVDPEKYLP